MYLVFYLLLIKEGTVLQIFAFKFCISMFLAKVDVYDFADKLQKML